VGDAHRFGHRLDHILRSPELEPLEADYVHEWRTERRSDHSAMWARFAPGADHAYRRRGTR
jgi:hypothetical protein